MDDTKRNMSGGKIAIIAVVAVVLILIVGAIGSYNSLVGSKEKVDSQWANIDTQLQRRLDLVPNLVETVKGYAAHETAVMTAVSDARAKLAGAGNNVQEASAANSELSSALSRLLVVVENYPDLKASTQYTALQDELAGTENRIAVARKDYNDTVSAYNQNIKKFPTVIFAKMFRFNKAEYFEAQNGAQTAPTVDFGV